MRLGAFVSFNSRTTSLQQPRISACSPQTGFHVESCSDHRQTATRQVWWRRDQRTVRI